MSLSIIVAMTPERVIGVDNRLPWHLPEDLKRFKRLTMGHPIIMGRKTFESIGRALPGRQNIVVSTNRDLKIVNVLVVPNLEEALFQCDGSTGEEFVIGGARLFYAALPKAKKFYLTIVHSSVQGDVTFPEFNENDFEWTIPEVSHPSENIQTTFSVGVRKSS